MTPLWASEVTNLALVLLLTFAPAIASWHFVERQALALKEIPLRRRQPTHGLTPSPSEDSQSEESASLASPVGAPVSQPTYP
jgi:hypothetical protein